MTEPPTNNRFDSADSVIKALLSDMRNPWTIAAGITAFAIGSLSTFFTLRMAQVSVQLGDFATESGIRLLAATPWEITLMQARVAGVVGLLLACETVLYRMRHTLLLDRWRIGWGHYSSTRIGVLVAGGAAFIVGGGLGYKTIVPVLFELLAETGPSLAITHVVELACYTVVSTGILAQLTVYSVFVAGSRIWV